MGGADVEPVEPGAGCLRQQPSVTRQRLVGLGKFPLIRQRPDDGQVVRAGAAKARTPLQLGGIKVLGIQVCGQCWRYLVQQAQVLGVLLGAGFEVLGVELEGRTQGVFIAHRRRDVALGADHAAQCAAGGGGRQAADLSANTLERQGVVAEQLVDLGGAGKDHHRCAGEHLVAAPELPVLAGAAQFADRLGEAHADVRMLCQLATECGRMRPTGLRIEKPAAGQRDPGQLLGLLATDRVQQLLGEGCRQLALALYFLGIEGQLQHAARLPGVAGELLQQAPGVAEAGDYVAREGGVVRRQLHVEHALWVARSLLGQRHASLDDLYLPASPRQAGRRRAAGHAAADDQRTALGRTRRSFEPARARLNVGRTVETSGKHLALVAETRHSLHSEARLDQPAADEACAGEGRQRRAGRRKPRQFGEQRRAPHVRILRRGKTVEEPGIDARVQLRQSLQNVADQQRQAYPAVSENQPLEARRQGDILLQQGCAETRQFRPQVQRALQIRGT